MKKKMFCIFLVFAIAASGFALDVEGKAPEFKANSTEGQTILDEFQNKLDDAFNSLLDGVNKEVSKFKLEVPEEFLQAMGNSAVYASHGGTHRAYAGYKIFAVSLGPMVGIQLPAGLKELANNITNLHDSLKYGGDFNFGISPQLFNIHLGLHPSFLPFWPKDLYIGARFGYFNFSPTLIDGFSSNALTLGLTANYQLLPKISLAKVIEWRGISLGSGILVNNSKVKFSLPIGDGDGMGKDLGGDYADVKININPELTLNLKINTVTVPLEAITAIKLVFLNIPFGVGADVAFGKSAMRIGIDSDINVTGFEEYGVEQSKPGDFSVNQKGETRPAFFNFKIMTGLGFTFGPVMLDIPFTYYPKKDGGGYNLGCNIGIAL